MRKERANKLNKKRQGNELDNYRWRKMKKNEKKDRKRKGDEFRN
jgi:hypothetical protein